MIQKRIKIKNFFLQGDILYNCAKNYMQSLMITWTDVFNGIGDLCTNGIFPVLRALGHKSNIILGGSIVGLLFYWMYKIPKLNKEAEEKGTLK